MKHTGKTAILILTLISMAILSSCEDDEKKPANDKLAANFMHTPEAPKVSEEVLFTSTSENATGFTWDFGDGNVSTDEHPKHRFTHSGSFTVKLVVVNTEGESNETTKEITIAENTEGSTVIHENDITIDEVWSNKYIHVIAGEIEVKNASLTIEAGSIVKFEQSGGLVFGISKVESSKLIAKGTSEKPITFTSIKENPEAGNWRYIYFGEYGSNESIMEFCNIMYAGGYADYSGAVIIDNRHIIFNNNTVKFSKSNGLLCYEEGYFTSFKNNEISENKKNSLKISANYAHTLGDNNLLSNTANGILLYGNLDKAGDYKWKKQVAKFTIESSLHIGSTEGTRLTIEKGNEIAIRENGRIEIGNSDNAKGTLIAKGTPEDKITFTAISKTDTWNCIYFGKNTGSGSILQYCNISHGGDSTNTNATIICNAGIQNEPSILNNHISDSKSNGILIKNSTPIIKDNTFENIAKENVKNN